MDYAALYYRCSRAELICHISHGAERVLDVGCGEGTFGANLKKLGLAQKVIGIELIPTVAKLAESFLDHVICDDIESIDLETIGREYGPFDYIICGDVLEHLRDPWSVLRSLSLLMTEGGHLIASIPNVRYWGVVLPLLCKGEWEYSSHGIMDRTHLRYFTRKTAIRLFEQAGLKILRCESGEFRRRLDRIINTVTLGFCRDFITVQWTLVGARREK